MRRLMDEVRRRGDGREAAKARWNGRLTIGTTWTWRIAPDGNERRRATT